MKKNKIIELIGGLSIAVAGIAVVVSGVKENKVESVNAETSKVFLHATSLWDQSNAWFAIYSYKDGQSPVWTKMTKVTYEGTDQSYYVGEYTVGYNFIFVRMNPAMSEPSWDAKWNQTYDLSGVPSEKNCYQIDNNSGSKADGSWHDFNPSATNTEYVVGTFGGHDNWDVSSGIKLVSHSTDEIKATIPLKAGDQFRFYVDSYLDPNYETSSKLVLKSGITVDISKSGDNFVAGNTLTEGPYILYWSYAAENWGLWIQSSVDTCDSLSCYIMQSETVGQCVTKFPTAKTRYLAMGDADKASFQTLAATPGTAAERYVQWASYLGQKPWEEGAASVSPKTNTISTLNDSGTSAWIIAVASLFSLTVLGSLVFYKKRRQK